MPVAVAVLEILDALAQKLADRLFEGFTQKVEGYLERRKVQAAKGRVVVQVFDSVQAFFQAEMKEDDAVLLAGQCLAAVEKVDFSPKTFAQHGYDPQKVSEWLLAQHPPHPDIATLQLSSTYSRLLFLVAQRLCDLAHLLPEWERANWEQTFARLERIEDTQKQQTELMKELQAEPVKRRQTLETQYCRFLENELSQIEVKGVRGVAEVLSLSLGTAYIELKLAKRPDLPRKAEKGPHQAKLADLESVPEELERLCELAEALGGRSVGEILAESRRVVIVGEPGSGKTTLLQRLALSAARGELGQLHPKLGEPLVPFLLPVRSLDFSHLPAPSEFLGTCAPLLQSQESGEMVRDMLHQGRGIILLDGLDECQVPPEAEMRKSRPDNELTEWDRVVRWLQAILKAFPETRVVVSSRSSGYAWGLLKETGFSESEILPLDKEDREQFVRHWYHAALRYKVEATGPEAEALRRDAEMKAADLLRRIEKTPSVHLLGRTPLMLAVLCIIHHYRGQSLPERRVELLKECVDVLLYEWRKAHGLQKMLGDLDAGRQRGLLQPLAWEMLQEGKAEFPRERVEEIFRNHLPDINLGANRAPEILDTICDRTGVLIERRPDVLAFAHLILQEYLAAEEAARHDPDILLQHADDAGWREVIPLAVGCNKGAQETFIRSLRDKGHLALAGRCVAAAERLDARLRTELITALVGQLDRGPFGSIRSQSCADVLVEIGGQDVARELVNSIEGVKLQSNRDRRTELAARVACALTVHARLRTERRHLHVLVYTADMAADHAAVAAAAVAERAASFAAEHSALTAAGATVTFFAVAAAVGASVQTYAAVSEAAGSAVFADAFAEHGESVAHLGEPALPALEQFLSRRGGSAHHRLIALSPYLELLIPERIERFFEHIGLCPKTDFPLCRLALFARFSHRLGQDLSSDQRVRLTYHLQSAYRELGRHYVRFAQAVSAELAKRDKPGITDDWEAYQAQFMALYAAKLDEKRPPGWGEPFPSDPETVRILLSAGEPDYDIFCEIKRADARGLERILSALMESDDRTIVERAGQVLLTIYYHPKETLG